MRLIKRMMVLDYLSLAGRNPVDCLAAPAMGLGFLFVPRRAQSCGLLGRARNGLGIYVCPSPAAMAAGGGLPSLLRSQAAQLARLGSHGGQQRIDLAAISL